jgi:hypothetical protein
MEIELVRTWREVQAHLDWTPDPLRVLSVLNLGKICSWSFALTFDDASRSILEVRRDAPMTLTDVRSILDAGVPEILFADQIRLAFDLGFAEAEVRTHRLAGSSSSALTFEGDDITRQISAIEIIGFFGSCVDHRLQEPSAVEKYVYKHTRLGSHVYRRHRVVLDWSILGTRAQFANRSRLEAAIRSGGPSLIKEFELPDGLGHIILASHKGLDEGALYHSEVGWVDPSQIPKRIRREWRRGPPLLMELQSSALSTDVSGRLGPRDNFERSLVAVQTVAQSFMETDEFRDYLATRRKAKAARAAVLLEQRQREARQADYVYFRDKLVMRKPSCENELVALFMKLETLGAIPLPECRVLEYTSQQGIDALADYKLLAEETLALLAPVEFEFEFENFFRHAHPEAQVRLVVCWDVRGDPPSLPDGATFEVSRERPWHGRYSSARYNIDVLLLSRLADLHVRKRR